MSHKKKLFSNIIQINGSLSGNIKYILYGIYFLLFVAIWHLCTGTAIRPFSEIFASLEILFVEDYFLGDIGYSVKLSLTAIFLSTIVTLIISYLSTFPLVRPGTLIISKGRFLGVLGIYYIFIVAFGLGFSLKVALLTFGITVFFLTSMYTVITEIPQSQFDYARSLGLTDWQVFWQVVIRGTADQMLESLRQNAAIGWMMIPAVETIVKTGGIGDVLWDNIKHFDRGKALAVMFCIIFIGIVQDIFLRELQRIITPHISVKK
ncbi:MAG: ABC transporter permease subunit [Desulfobacteraceae bacterium]|nr:ABC transporter permease subunit [Desulfobacteraceae bacterium]